MIAGLRDKKNYPTGCGIKKKHVIPWDTRDKFIPLRPYLSPVICTPPSARTLHHASVYFSQDASFYFSKESASCFISFQPGFHFLHSTSAQERYKSISWLTVIYRPVIDAGGRVLRTSDKEAEAEERRTVEAEQQLNSYENSLE